VTATQTIQTQTRALEPGVVDVWLVDVRAVDVSVRRREGSPTHGSAGPQPEVAAILARYTGDAPDRIRFVRERNGKPKLDRGGLDVRFSVSRTEGTMVLAVALGIEVGVDVELIREGPWRALPAHALSHREQTDLATCRPEARVSALLTYWTRKEAILKAAGVGLSIEPQRIEVTAPWAEAALTALPPTLAPLDRWTLLDLAVPGCAAALAAEAPGIVARLAD
jgi:4'-phosphopantetheinyl transferase